MFKSGDKQKCSVRNCGSTRREKCHQYPKCEKTGSKWVQASGNPHLLGLTYKEVFKSPSTKERPEQVPEVIKKFIQRFQQSIKGDSPSSTQTIFLYISEKLVLPETSKIAELVEHDKLFLIVYEQMYNRQVHASKTPPKLNQRIKSFENYQNLFHYILEENFFLQLRLPDQWLWDIVDDFLDQYESFCHYRENLKNKTEEEIESLKAKDELWDVLYIFEILHKLLDRAKTEIQSKTSESRNLLYKKLGHIAIYGLQRVHTLQADYYNAIKILDVRSCFTTTLSKVVFSSLPGCQFSVAYHAGFSYMMMRRYVDAIDILVNSLRYFQENMKMFQELSYQNKKIQGYVENMLNLVCMCLVLYHIVNTVTYLFISQNAIEKLFKANNCEKRIDFLEEQLDLETDSPEFKTIFLKSCPKFVLPKPPSLEEPPEDYSMKVTQNQLKVFLEEIKNHCLISKVKFELELILYEGKRISLVSFTKDYLIMIMAMAQDEPFDIKTSLKRPMDVIKAEGLRHLLRMKHKQTQAVRMEDPTSSGLDYTLETASGIDFYIDKEMIRIIGNDFF